MDRFSQKDLDELKDRAGGKRVDELTIDDMQAIMNLREAEQARRVFHEAALRYRNEVARLNPSALQALDTWLLAGSIEIPKWVDGR